MTPTPKPPPRDYQIAGSNFLAARPYALLADDMGLGKSYQAILAWEAQNCRRILIVCPAVSRLVWPQQVDTWQTQNLPCTVIAPGTTAWDERAIQALVTASSGIVIVAFDTFSTTKQNPTSRAIVAALSAVPWDLVLIDECQRLANPGSVRTQQIYGRRLDRAHSVTQDAKRIWLLTGTPTPNNASEIYPHARALWPDALAGVMEHWQFVERYCTYHDTTYGRSITGSKNQIELRKRLGNYVLRRRKTDVLTELPPLDFVVTPVPAEVLTAMGSDLAVPADLEGDALLEFVGSHTAQLATLRRRMGVLKVAPSVAYVEDMIDAGVRKILVFAHHTEVIASLQSQLADHHPVVITGSTNTASRKDAVQAFMFDDRTRVLIGQLDACGVSITLTAASDVVFVECSWTPAVNAQCAARAHRLGQRNAVLARMLTVPGSLDERIVNALTRKARDIAALWDGAADTNEVQQGVG